MAVITIVGAGMMGSALAFPARENGHEVRKEHREQRDGPPAREAHPGHRQVSQRARGGRGCGDPQPVGAAASCGLRSGAGLLLLPTPAAGGI